MPKKATIFNQFAALECVNNHPMRHLEPLIQEIYVEWIKSEGKMTRKLRRLLNELEWNLHLVIEPKLIKLSISDTSWETCVIAKKLVLWMVTEGFQQYDATRPFYPWGYQKILNRCESYRRKYFRQATQGFFVDVIDPRSSVLDSILRKEQRQRVRLAVKKLPLKQRQLIYMTYWDDLPNQDAAEALNLTPMAVRLQLHRARKKLFVLLTKKRRGLI